MEGQHGPRMRHKKAVPPSAPASMPPRPLHVPPAPFLLFGAAACGPCVQGAGAALPGAAHGLAVLAAAQRHERAGGLPAALAVPPAQRPRGGVLGCDLRVVGWVCRCTCTGAVHALLNSKGSAPRPALPACAATPFQELVRVEYALGVSHLAAAAHRHLARLQLQGSGGGQAAGQEETKPAASGQAPVRWARRDCRAAAQSCRPGWSGCRQTSVGHVAPQPPLHAAQV